MHARAVVLPLRHGRQPRSVSLLGPASAGGAGPSLLGVCMSTVLLFSKCAHERTYRPGSCVVDPPHMCVPTHSCLPFDTLCRRCPRSPACCCPVTLPAPCVSGPISVRLFVESAYPLALWTAAAVAARPAVGGLVGRRVCSSQQAACFGNLVARSLGILCAKCQPPVSPHPTTRPTRPTPCSRAHQCRH